MTESEISLTPIQQRIMDVLADGRPHLEKDLVKCLEDDLGTKETLRVHLTAIRKKIRPGKKDIIFTIDRRRACYQLIGLLHT